MVMTPMPPTPFYRTAAILAAFSRASRDDTIPVRLPAAALCAHNDNTRRAGAAIRLGQGIVRCLARLDARARAEPLSGEAVVVRSCGQTRNPDRADTAPALASHFDLAGSSTTAPEGLIRPTA
jgi:hypothetical protein